MINQDCSSSLYRTMLENMQDGFLHCKAIGQSKEAPADYEVIEINKSFTAVLRVSEENIKNRRFSEILYINESTKLFFEYLSKRLKATCHESNPELYDPFFKRWHSVSIFDGGKGEYTMLIKDITDATIFNEQKRIYKNTRDFFCILDFQGNFISHNGAWEKLLGYTGEELEIKRLWDLLHMDDGIANKLKEGSILNEKAISFETIGLKKNGEQVCLQFNIYPVIERKLLYVTAHDITELKKVEEKLREGEERLQFALEGSESGAWDWDIEKNKQVYSKAWKQMLGHEENEISTNIEEWTSRIHPDDIEYARKMTEDYLKGLIPSYNCEHRLRCKNGQYKWILSRAKIMKRNPEGKPLRMTGIHTDITELKSLLEELIELTNQYDIVFNGTQDALFLVSVDEDGKFRYNRLNSSHERLTGLTTEAVKGKTPQDVVGKRVGKRVEAAYSRCVKEGQVIRYEETMNLPAGRKIWRTRLYPVVRGGRVAYIVGSSRDITEQKSIEASRKKAENEIKHLNESIAYENLKTEFFSNLSHELKTPLNVILCSVQLTNLLVGNSEDQKLKDSLYRNMKIMKQNSYRLLRLVNNLIDITKIDSGYYDLSLVNCDVVKFLEDIVMSIETYAQNKLIKLCFISDVQQRIMALDMEKIERIMLNLFSNAVKFTEAGGEIKVHLYEEKDKFFVSVKDTGIGIPEEKLGIIFNRFTRVDKTMTRRQEGSGIGLALVKSLVELHGGSISVKSKLGEGSEFLIELPISLVEKTSDGGFNLSMINRDVTEHIDIEFSDIYA